MLPVDPRLAESVKRPASTEADTALLLLLPPPPPHPPPPSFFCFLFLFAFTFTPPLPPPPPPLVIGTASGLATDAGATVTPFNFFLSCFTFYNTENNGKGGKVVRKCVCVFDFLGVGK
jgi:hypothetical protein